MSGESASAAGTDIAAARSHPFDTVPQVLAIAQRSGMQRIGFAGQERFKE